LRPSFSKIPEDFIDVLDNCASLIDEETVKPNKRTEILSDPLPSLLEQCKELSKVPADCSDTIRTIHHFACTGGTLVAKCIASMPNTQVISEAQPHSQMVAVREQRFAPTDLIHLVRASSRGSTTELDSKIFNAGLDVLFEDCRSKGISLVLRDHAHSKYCTGKEILNVPSLLNTIRPKRSLQSIVTVRHPLDSFLSLENNDWKHFEPFTLAEYSRRYLKFLRDHRELQIIKYEDLVEDPETWMRSLCARLDIGFNNAFMAMIGVHRLSGDSGRSASRIAKRAPREINESVTAELTGSNESYRALCNELGYPAHIEC